MKTLTLQKKNDGPSRTAVVGTISIVLMILAGSIYPVFGKKLTTAFSPLSLLFISEMMGGLFIMLSFGLLPLIKKLRKVKRREGITLLWIAITSGVLAPYFWFAGLHGTTAVNAELYSRSEMIFLILLSAVILRERLTKHHFLSLGIILFGVLCVALKGFTVGFSMGSGDVLIVASAITYAFGGIFVKRDLKNVHPELIIFTRALCATAFFFASSAFVSQNFIAELRTMPSDIVGALLVYGFVGKFLGTYSFHEAIETLKVATVSMFSTLAVVGGMTFAALYLGEEIHGYQMVGAAFIVLGVLSLQHVGHHATRKVHEHHMRQHHRHHL